MHCLKVAVNLSGNQEAHIPSVGEDAISVNGQMELNSTSFTFLKFLHTGPRPVCRTLRLAVTLLSLSASKRLQLNNNKKEAAASHLCLLQG